MNPMVFRTFRDVWGYDSPFIATGHPMQPQWKESDDSYTMEVVIPGAEKKDVVVEKKDSILVLSFKGNDYNGKFSYEYSLPKETTSDDITAKYKAGVLTVTIKKAEIKKEAIKVQ